MRSVSQGQGLGCIVPGVTRSLLLGLLVSHLACAADPATRCVETSEPAPPPAVETEPAAVADAPARDVPAPAVERERHEVKADDGHAIAVWARVPPQPRGAIVLLHGRTWSGRPDFDLQVEGESRSTMQAFADEGIAAYALDLRGYGDTPRDATGWNTPDRAAGDLIAVLEWVRDRHDGAAPTLLGWSLGSLTSQLAAQQRPELVSTLVLYGYPRNPDRRYKAERDEGPPPAKATTAEAAASDFIIPGNISKAGIDAFVEQALAADPVRSDWRGSDQWNALDPSKVTVPTLVLHGAKDPYAPQGNQAKLFSRLGTEDKAWKTIAGGDHAAHLEDVGPRFMAAVLSFMHAPR
jgi:pimeloyl-ACP methyl ester carboxylesterase